MHQYASGALSKCRKVGATNWGNSKKKVMAKEGLRKWFSRNQGKGWVDCKTGKPCGRRKGEKRKS